MDQPDREKSRSEQVSDDLIEGKMPCDECPDLKRMVEQAKKNRLAKDELEQIIDYHLRVNEEKKRIKNVF